MKTPFDAMTEALGMTEHPILFGYVDELPRGTLMPPEGARTCLFALLARTRADGRPVALSAAHQGCAGGGYYLGFREAPRDGIEHFLSCGIPGRIDGERYLKTPEIARARLAQAPVRPAAGKFGLFTRSDGPPHGEAPGAVIFFANPDQVAGLHMLAGFDRDDDAVVAPFTSGCGAIAAWPLAEAARPRPRAVLGLFDPSARPFVEENLLTFAVPYAMFERMAANVPESFLTTRTWGAIRKRIRDRETGGRPPAL